MQVDGASHVVHSEEEPTGTRLMIDSLTCLLANESDPSRLTTNSPGKIIKRLLNNEDHVAANQAYAEIEVCASSGLELSASSTFPNWSCMASFLPEISMSKSGQTTCQSACIVKVYSS